MTQSKNAKYKVLLVDDHLISLKLMARQCQIMGFTSMETAPDGAMASKLLQEGRYDLVILDWSMPKKDGFLVLQDCRRDRKFDSTAFVMCSAEAQENYIDEALRAGATSYLIKPVTQDVFEEKINIALAWLEKAREGSKHA